MCPEYAAYVANTAPRIDVAADVPNLDRLQ